MEQTAPSSPELAPHTDTGDAPSFAIPNLLFENRTEFSALQFDTVDQHDAAFHVVVAKIAYAIGPCDGSGQAVLKVLDEPPPLNTEDRYYDDDAAASVLEESDFAPYKPKCDIIVNAVAYAPAGKATRSFNLRLSVSTPAEHANPQRLLIDKALAVCGPRWFVKKLALQRWIEWAIKIVTVGLIRPNPWRLSRAQPISHLPIRYEHALGGQCRIDANHPAAKRVPKKHRITNDHTSNAIAHEACETNPIGKGFARSWFLKVEKSTRIPAPQISKQGEELSVRDFINGVHGKALRLPAGLGAIGRAWLPRRTLVGKIEEKSSWARDEVPRLPTEFDYAYWNGAPTDQQCDYLSGLEEFSLTNLCRLDNSSAQTDRQGNRVLRFKLPQQAMVILAATHDAKATILPLSLDTVVINPESNRVHLVWRGHLEADGTYTEARLMRVTDPGQIERMNELVREQSARAAEQEQTGV